MGLLWPNKGDYEMSIKNANYKNTTIGTSMGKIDVDEDGFLDADSNTEAMLVRTFGFMNQERPAKQEPAKEGVKEEAPKKKATTTRKTTRKVVKKEVEE